MNIHLILLNICVEYIHYDTHVSSREEIYRTTNDADLQGILNVKLKLEPQSVSKDVVSTLIAKLGLSLEEALMRLMG